MQTHLLAAVICASSCAILFDWMLAFWIQMTRRRDVKRKPQLPLRDVKRKRERESRGTSAGKRGRELHSGNASSTPEDEHVDDDGGKKGGSHGVDEVQREYLKWILRFVSLLCLYRHFTVNYSSLNNSNNFAFLTYAENIIATVPLNGTLLANGDENCGSIQYYLRCEVDRKHTRNDINFIRLELLSYPWWITSQSRWYPNLSWPGRRYFPNETGSFNMLEFVQANANLTHPIYVIGSWKHGDDSVNAIERVPVGLADMAIPSSAIPSLSKDEEMDWMRSVVEAADIAFKRMSAGTVFVLYVHESFVITKPIYSDLLSCFLL